jgi:hypothetical protein
VLEVGKYLPGMLPLVVSLCAPVRLYGFVEFLLQLRADAEDTGRWWSMEPVGSFDCSKLFGNIQLSLFLWSA